MKRMIWIESVATIAALMVSGIYMPAAAQQTKASTLPTDVEIRTILSDRVDAEHRTVGIVVGIITTGRRIIAHGRTKADSSQVLDGDTVFEIGSVTKVFTSMVACGYGPPARSEPRRSRWLVSARRRHNPIEQRPDDHAG